MAIPLGRSSPSASCDRPERRREDSPGILGSLRRCLPLLLGLAPGGVFPAAAVAGGAVRSYRTISPLPPARHAGDRLAVYFLWHFPWGRPRRGLPGTVPPWSPDFPLPAHPRRAAIRPSGMGRFGQPWASVKAPAEASIIGDERFCIARKERNAMPVILGTHGYRYEVKDDWAKLPPGMEFNADVAAVGVDEHDNVYAFNRGKHPMCVFDRDGKFLRSWGEGVFVRPHGVFMAPDGTILLSDDGDHTVRQCTLDGKVLLTIGTPGKPAPFMSGLPFHRCTHTALAPNGDIYVSDGYCNARVHKFAPDGRHILSWGSSGIGPGEFNI